LISTSDSDFQREDLSEKLATCLFSFYRVNKILRIIYYSRFLCTGFDLSYREIDKIEKFK